MTRLLIASALTGAGTSNVHFVDADRASFSYSSSASSVTKTTRDGGPNRPSVHVDNNSLAPAHRGGDGAGETEDAPVVQTQGAAGARGGGPHRRQQQQQQQQPRQEEKKAAAEAAAVAAVSATAAAATPKGQPRAGQVGLLEFDPRGRGSEFVLSLESSVSDRLTVTAGVGTSTESLSGEGGERGKRLQGGGSVRGGGGGGARYSGQGDSPRKPVCVRYLKTVGQKTVQRKDWFPSPEDALSLRSAIDTYCPVPFLRGDGEGEGWGARHRRGGEGGGEGSGGAGRVRRLLLYQRDQNRQIRHSNKVRVRVHTTESTAYHRTARDEKTKI